jgi:hypothetical protein
MTRLDIIQALMVGAGISQYQAAKIMREHDAEVRRKALAGAERRDRFAAAALSGVLARFAGIAPPEQLVRQVLQHVDILIKELDL